MSLSDYLAIAALISTAVLGYLQWRLGRKRLPSQISLDNATAAKDISSAWKEFVDAAVEPLQARIVELESKNTELRERVAALEAVNRSLVVEIKRFGDEDLLLRTQVTLLNGEVILLIEGVKKLCRQIKSAGLVPVWEYVPAGERGEHAQEKEQKEVDPDSDQPEA